MTLPDLPKLGSRELMRHRERAVVVDAELWRERPTELNASMLRDSVDQWILARDAFHAVTLAVQEEMKAENTPSQP